MLYKKLVSLSLVGMLSFGVLVGCESENQEVKELQEQVAKLEQQIAEQEKETTKKEEKTENEVKKEEPKKEETKQEQPKEEEEGSSICIGCGRHFVGSQTGYCNEYECAKKGEAALQKDYIEMLKDNAINGDNNAMLELANQGICPYCFSRNTWQTFSPDSLTCNDCGSCY